MVRNKGPVSAAKLLTVPTTEMKGTEMDDDNGHTLVWTKLLVDLTQQQMFLDTCSWAAFYTEPNVAVADCASSKTETAIILKDFM